MSTERPETIQANATHLLVRFPGGEVTWVPRAVAEWIAARCDELDRLQAELATAAQRLTVLRETLATGEDREQIEELRDRVHDCNDLWVYTARKLMQAASCTDYDHEAEVHNEALQNLLKEMQREDPVEELPDGVKRLVRKMLEEGRA